MCEINVLGVRFGRYIITVSCSFPVYGKVKQGKGAKLLVGSAYKNFSRVFFLKKFSYKMYHVNVVHVIHWLLRYVSSNDKYSKVWRILFENTWYMKFCSRTKCWQVTLRFNCHNKFPFFQKKNQLFSDLLFAYYRMTTIILKYPDRVNFYIYASICYFNFLIISVVVIFFNILPDFSANIFFTLSSLQTIYNCLFRPRKQSSIFLTPRLQKKNGLSFTVLILFTVLIFS